MIQINLYTFPNIEYGYNYKDTQTYRLYSNDKLLTEIKSVLIKTFDPKTKTIKSLKIVNEKEEIKYVADFLFKSMVIMKEVKSQCNHTFISNLFQDDWIFVNFFTDDILKEKPIDIYN